MTLREAVGIKEADLILVRGIPGSGKTTYVNKNLKGYKHYEADQYFEKDGEYKFNPQDIKKAHSECFQNTKRSLKNGDKVVVSNTFTKKWELANYLKLANELDKKVKILRTTKQFKNTHGVPEDKVKEMIKRFEDIEDEVKV